MLKTLLTLLVSICLNSATPMRPTGIKKWNLGEDETTLDETMLDETTLRVPFWNGGKEALRSCKEGELAFEMRCPLVWQATKNNRYILLANSGSFFSAMSHPIFKRFIPVPKNPMHDLRKYYTQEKVVGKSWGPSDSRHRYFGECEKEDLDSKKMQSFLCGYLDLNLNIKKNNHDLEELSKYLASSGTNKQFNKIFNSELFNDDYEVGFVPHLELSRLYSKKFGDFRFSKYPNPAIYDLHEDDGLYQSYLPGAYIGLDWYMLISAFYADNWDLKPIPFEKFCCPFARFMDSLNQPSTFIKYSWHNCAIEARYNPGLSIFQPIHERDFELFSNKEIKEQIFDIHTESFDVMLKEPLPTPDGNILLAKLQGRAIKKAEDSGVFEVKFDGFDKSYFISRLKLKFAFSHFTDENSKKRIKESGKLKVSADGSEGKGLYVTSLGTLDLQCPMGGLNNNYWPVFTAFGEIERKNMKSYHQHREKLLERLEKMKVQIKIWIDGDKIDFDGNADGMFFRQINHGGSDVWYYGKGNETPDFLQLEDLGDVQYIKMK